MERKIYVIENNELTEVKDLWEFVKRIASEMNASIAQNEIEPVTETQATIEEEEEDDEDYGFYDKPVKEKEKINANDRYHAPFIPYEDEDIHYAVGRAITQFECDFLLRVKTFNTVSGKQKALVAVKLEALNNFYSKKKRPSEKKYK